MGAEDSEQQGADELHLRSSGLAGGPLAIQPLFARSCADEACVGVRVSDGACVCPSTERVKPTIYLSTLSALFVGGYAAQLRVQLTCISGILARLKGVVERSRYLPHVCYEISASSRSRHEN